MNSCERDLRNRQPAHLIRGLNGAGVVWEKAGLLVRSSGMSRTQLFEFGHTLVILETFDPPRVNLTVS
jgi:hypothetical protein